MSDINTAQPGAEAATEVKPVAETQAETPVNGSESAAEQDQQESKPRDEKGRFVPQERVNEITRARREAERERDYLRQQLAQVQQQQPQYQAANDQPPRIEDFKDFNELNAANVRYLESRAYEAARQQLEIQQQQSYQQQIASQFETRATSYEAANPGFAERFETLMTTFSVPPQITEALAVSEAGPQVFDYLAQHMDEADRIFRMAPHLAAIQLGRIEERLTAPRPKPVSNAPAPIPTLGGGSQTLKDPARMTDAEWYESTRKGR